MRWRVGAAIVAALVLLPVAAIFVLASRTGDGALAHLARTVLWTSLIDTLLVMTGTGIAAAVIGTSTAWLATMYRFPGRALLDRLLVLPLAMPIYIVAFCYVELLDFAGPVQSAWRGLVGADAARRLGFPDIRSVGGAVLIASLTLYPYVYLTARASFVQQSVCVLEVARTLGRSSVGAFYSVALPLARPALVAGVALVAMECMNEFGAMQHLGVNTLTVAVYATWLQRGSLPGAAQIAVFALVVVVALLMLERHARRGARFHNSTGRFRAIPFQDLSGLKAAGAFAVCFVPVLFGFIVPLAVLVHHAVAHAGLAFEGGFWMAALRSILLAAAAGIVTVAAALVVAYARRVTRSTLVGTAVVIAGLGYALPGTVLALGLKLPLSAFDNALDGVARSVFGVSAGLLVSGTVVILLAAYMIRFLAVSLGAIEAGLARLSPNLDAVARTLGETASTVLRRVHLPLLAPALGSAALLVFVDTMKELPATLLLRPFNFETLATHVYGLAALEQFEAAGLGSLVIVLAGLVPVLLLHRAVAGGRAGSQNDGAARKRGHAAS